MRHENAIQQINGEKRRNSSFELLRVLAMLSIVSGHFAIHGGFSFPAALISIPRIWCDILEFNSNIGVDVFILITGFYLIRDERLLNIRKILKFWGQVFFYSSLIFLVFLFTGHRGLSLTRLYRAILPITSGSWWFVSMYFALFLIHPFLNVLIRGLRKSGLQKMLLLLLLITSVLPTLTNAYFIANRLLWFMTLYCTAAYISLYGIGREPQKWKLLLIGGASALARFLSSVILMLIGTKIPAVSSHATYFYGVQSVLTFLCAVCVFLIFQNLKPRYHKWINILASATFGVYLIHDHYAVRPFLWKTLFRNASYQNTALLIPYSLAVITLVYVVCTGFELLRIWLIERPYMKLVDRVSPPLTGLCRSVVRKVAKLLK